MCWPSWYETSSSNCLTYLTYCWFNFSNVKKLYECLFNPGWMYQDTRGLSLEAKTVRQRLMLSVRSLKLVSNDLIYCYISSCNRLYNDYNHLNRILLINAFLFPNFLVIIKRYFCRRFEQKLCYHKPHASWKHQRYSYFLYICYSILWSRNLLLSSWEMFALLI